MTDHVCDKAEAERKQREMFRGFWLEEQEKNTELRQQLQRQEDLLMGGFCYILECLRYIVAEKTKEKRGIVTTVREKGKGD